MFLQLVALGLSWFTHVVRSHVVVLSDPCVSQGLESQPCRSLAAGPGPSCLTHLASQSFSFPSCTRGRQEPLPQAEGHWSVVSTCKG